MCYINARLCTWRLGMKGTSRLSLTGRVVVAALVGLVARTGPTPQRGPMIIRSYGSNSIPLFKLQPKEDPLPQPRKKLQPARSKMNRFAVTRVYKPDRKRH